MPRVWKALVIGADLALGVVGCSQATRVAGPRPMPAASVQSPRGTSSEALAPQLIRRGKMGVTVDQVDVSRKSLERAASELGAFVAHLDAHGAEHADYLFRVAPTRMDALMDSAATLGFVGERRVSLDDVTDQVVDAQGRLTSLRASRDRLRALLDRAGGVSDVITVERELARVQSEIESLEGRLAVLQGAVALSEVNVRLDRKHELGPVSKIAVGIGHALRKLFILN
jgi:uncharacterized protein DUF4349